MKKFCSFCFIFITAVASADVAVIVNPSNASALTDKDIQRIFLGKAKSFPDGGNAAPVNIVTADPLREEFDDKVLGRSSSQVTAYWSKLVFTGKGVPPSEVNDASAVIAEVTSKPNAIGYVDVAAVTDAVKVVATF
ncbi:phosphate ABC transporter substrate-binding protein [Alteromonas sediminis]|uniref:Phosphate ABC transporter substrate-binding protein n=1 Tax=Alteromonas sediminis TaxID=2259342 RepID=A0A3N5ZAD3_9ALTE|nr:phosphate ABC transporter substrate-binding protein [Alteromonas sediminis]RPJ68034.1 phosphate ABC transporter substrate-binding protein [Alteromonas sediminis]